jgi:glycosyltransferase involved in cell wall biosynthesis
MKGESVMENLVSIVMPVFNSAEYLEEAMASVLSSKYKNIELLCINDGSVDNSLDILKKYSKLDARVKVINQENGGVGNALNHGLALSKGDYIAIMHSDDIMNPDRISMQVKLLQEKSLDIVGTSIRYFGAKNGIWRVFTTDSDLKTALLFGAALPHPTVMVKREVFQSYKYSKSTYCEDVDLWHRLAIENHKFGALKTVLLKYRKHAAQLSSINEDGVKVDFELTAKKYRSHLGVDNLIAHPSILSGFKIIKRLNEKGLYPSLRARYMIFVNLSKHSLFKTNKINALFWGVISGLV